VVCEGNMMRSKL